jgi:hypothetical protein
MFSLRLKNPLLVHCRLTFQIRRKKVFEMSLGDLAELWFQGLGDQKYIFLSLHINGKSHISVYDYKNTIFQILFQEFPVPV